MHRLPQYVLLAAVAICAAPSRGWAQEPFDAKAHFTAAYEQYRSAASIEDLTGVVDKCESALKDQKLSEYYIGYAHKLAAGAYNKRGELLDAEAKDQQALADFDAAVRHAPADATGRYSYLHNRAVSYARAGEFDKAAADFQEVIRLNPRFDRAWFNLGELHYAQGEFDQAINDYSQAIRHQPNNAAAYTSRGHAHYRKLDYRAALNDYNRAIQLSPRLPDPYVYRGDGYADVGMYDRARDDFNAALRIDEANVWANRSLAWLMSTCPREEYRNAQAAVEHAEKAARLYGGDHPRILDTLAAAYANAGEFDKAIEAEKKAIELSADESEEIKSQFQTRLERYQEERPYRHVIGSAAPRR